MIAKKAKEYVRLSFITRGDPMKYTVRNHITDFLKMKKMQNETFLTHDIQNLSNAWFMRFSYRLGSTETYTREFRRMRLDDIIEVEKLNRVNKEQLWRIKGIK